jgi:hypothetical protein
MTHSAWWAFCDALACYRLAILVTRDTITEPAREWLRRRAHPDPPPEDFPGHERMLFDFQLHTIARWRWLFDLVSCVWCVSIWAAAAIVALTKFTPGVWQYPAMGLALSAAAGFLTERSS